MKQVGVTTENNVLIEATQDEYRMLCYLADAVEGKTIDCIGMRRDSRVNLPDFYGVFGAIEAFSLAHYRLNELQELLDNMRAKINKREV